MKVKEIIEKLQQCDPEATVITSSSNFELRNADIEVTCVHQYDTGKKEIRTFTDAFDYEDYDTEIWTIVEGEEKIVYIA